MGISEKVAYLKGLAEGLKLDAESNEGKLFTAIIVALFLAVPYLKGKYFTKAAYKKEGSRHA